MQASSDKIRLLVLIIVAAALLAVGLVTPIITFKKFIFIQNTFSILSGTWNLLKEGQLFLFVIISLFSIVFPIFKLGFLTKLVCATSAMSSSSNKMLTLLHSVGRWSMLDVFIVAILVVVVKLGAIADVEKHIGLYAYTGAAILIMLITHMVSKKLKPESVSEH